MAVEAPGISIQAVLAAAKRAQLKELIGSDALRVLALLDQGVKTRERLLQLACSSVEPNIALNDHALRALIISMLPMSKACELARLLGVPLDRDLYTNLERKADQPASRETLLSFFGVVQGGTYANEARCNTVLIKPAYGLFDHQYSAAVRVFAALNEAPRKVVLHLPTGAGKTRVAMHVVARHFEDHDQTHDYTLTVWLAQSVELLEQAAAEFERAWSHLGHRSVPVIRFWGDHAPDIRAVHDGFLVAGFAKLQALSARDQNIIPILGDRTSLTIVDEAHQALALTYRAAIEGLTTKRPDNALLGLTATPGRTWRNIDQDARLAELFATKKATLLVPGYANPVKYLIDQGFLAQPQYRLLNSEAGLTLDDADRRALAEETEIPESILRCLGMDEQRNLKIIREIEELVKRHSRILVFAATVEHAQILTVILGARGLTAWTVFASTPRNKREAILNRFRRNDPQAMILCNYGVLTTGFDAPRTSCALIARPTKSLVLYSQMVGRATRGPKAGGNKTCEIVTVIDPDLPGFGSIADAFGNWEDVWNES